MQAILTPENKVMKLIIPDSVNTRRYLRALNNIILANTWICGQKLGCYF